MSVKVAINGFGRIGRLVFRAAWENKNVEIIGVNGGGLDTKTLVHLLKYDSIHGTWNVPMEAKEGSFSVAGKEFKVIGEKDPAKLPWKEWGVEVIVESTGKFTKREGAAKHLEAGAKKVVISAPATDEDITIVMGVNQDKYDPTNHQVISNASCTTNCLAPVAKVLQEKFGIVKGLMTTVHAYTNDQVTLDAGHKDLRRARAAGLSIIPTTTGAAKAVALVLPELKGKLNGYSLRVPTPNVSIVDLVVELAKSGVTKEDINGALKAAAEGELKGVLGYTDEPLVSMDYKGESNSSVVDGPLTMIIEGNMAKVVAWYDNEWGYSCRIVDLIDMIGKKGL